MGGGTRKQKWPNPILDGGETVRENNKSILHRKQQNRWDRISTVIKNDQAKLPQATQTNCR